MTARTRRLQLALVAGLLALAMSAVVALAASPTSETLAINDGTGGDQADPVLAMDAAGNFAVAWPERP